MPAASKRMKPRVIVINKERCRWWETNGEVEGTWPGGFHQLERGVPLAATGHIRLEFGTVASGHFPTTPAERLAMAVLEGDTEAALILADLVQEEWATTQAR